MNVSNFNIIYNYFIKRNYDNILNGYNYLVISIIGRYKDNMLPFNSDKYPESILVYKTLLIYNLNDIFKYKDYIITICDKLNARAYITTSPRSINSLNATLLNNISLCISNDSILNDNNVQLYQNIFDNSCKSAPVINDTDYYTFLLDIDKHITKSNLQKILDYLKNSNPDFYETPAGFHILCEQYNAKELHKFLETEFNNKGGNKFIDQKGKGCRALLYCSI